MCKYYYVTRFFQTAVGMVYFENQLYENWLEKRISSFDWITTTLSVTREAIQNQCRQNDSTAICTMEKCPEITEWPENDS